MFKFRPSMQTLETRENPSGPELIDPTIIVVTPVPAPAPAQTTPPPEVVPANP
jgi:hypothetical protein